MLEELKKKCNLRMAKCCATCCHFDYHEEDFGANYSQFCSCPENEDKSAKPGEDAFFEVSGFDVCDHWHGKDENGNPLRDVIRIEAEPRYPEDAEVNDEEEDYDNPKMPFLVKNEKMQNDWKLRQRFGTRFATAAELSTEGRNTTTMCRTSFP